MKINKIILAIFIFYLIIFSNYTKELLGCKLKKILKNNIYSKHLIAFILLYLLINIIDDDNNDENSEIYKFGYSFILYILFIITSRIPYYLIIIIFILLVILYNINKIKIKNKNEDKYIYMELFVILIIIFFMSIGFIFYGLEKYCEYGKNFSISTFIIGNIKCKN
jgi:hypothetical protein